MKTLIKELEMEHYYRRFRPLQVCGVHSHLMHLWERVPYVIVFGLLNFLDRNISFGTSCHSTGPCQQIFSEPVLSFEIVKKFHNKICEKYSNFTRGSKINISGKISLNRLYNEVFNQEDCSEDGSMQDPKYQHIKKRNFAFEASDQDTRIGALLQKFWTISGLWHPFTFYAFCGRGWPML